MSRAGPLRRLYRVRPLSALLLGLPGILLSVWYGWSAYASFDRYRRAVEPKRPLTAELFQLYLHDELRRDIRQAQLPKPPTGDQLPRLTLLLDGHNLDKLQAGAARHGKRPYVNARLSHAGTIQPVKVHLRGVRHWHLLGKKKSLKIKLPSGHLFEGRRTFNLVADPTAMLVGEGIVMRLAREMGLLAPHSSFARLRINGADLGIYRYDGHPDESLLREAHRMPGSVYSGNLLPRQSSQDLWGNGRGWKKVAWRNKKQLKDRAELTRLLAQLRHATAAEFAEFVRHEVNLRAFAMMDALDVAFGIDARDFRSNHKLYFDPYRGRWEPVLWQVRGFIHEPAFNLTENPILLRLKYVPEYLQLRNRLLYELLVGACSPAAVQARGMQLLKELGPELASDPYWTAYKLLPALDLFFAQMVRPMDLSRLALVFASDLATYEARHAYLLHELERNPLHSQLGPRQADGTARLRLTVDGPVGVRVTGFEAEWPRGCTQPTWQVLRGQEPLTAVSQHAGAAVEQALELLPGVEIVTREDKDYRRGDVRASVVPLAYDLTLRSRCEPLRIVAEGFHLATDSRVRSRPLTRTIEARLARQPLAADAVPTFRPGESGPHPWQLLRQVPRTITLGPGIVTIEQTRVFTAEERVTVAPGTRLRMGPGASLIFLGRTTIAGTSEQPVVIEPAGAERWGGIALQGPQTAGSRLSYLHVHGGSKPHWRLIPFPAMLDIQDTHDIHIEHGEFSNAQGSDDLLHVAYVQRLHVADTRLTKTAGDAIDLEFVEGELRGLRIEQAGDDGLDLMASEVLFADSWIAGCRDNGISAGEETRLRLRSVLVARCRVGLLVKNASQADVSSSLLFGNKIGVRVYKRTVRFAGDSEVHADVLFVVGSARETKTDKESRNALQLHRLQQRLPLHGLLDHLRADVLELSSWEELEPWLQRGAVP